MSNDTTMTIMGNLVDEPRLRRLKSGTIVTTFRVASTPRRYDRGEGRFVDNTTLFVTVSAWRALGENVAQSVRKGHPVVVTGRYVQKNYTVDEQPRTTYELEASSVGHDLSRGVTTFEKVFRSATPAVAVDEDGQPADDSEFYRDAEDPFDALTSGIESTGVARPAVSGEYEGDPAARGLAVAS